MYLEKRISRDGSFGAFSAAQKVPKALTEELQKSEQYGGMNSNVPIFLNGLSSKEFLESIQTGELFKDVGAGPPHGEYTHRIQWYIVTWAMSKEFTIPVSGLAPEGWSYTPRDLLIEIGKESVTLQDKDWPPMASIRNGSMWDALFDRPLDSGYKIEEDGISKPEVLNLMLINPEIIKFRDAGAHSQLEKINQGYKDAAGTKVDIYGQLSSKMESLSSIASQRYLKRYRYRKDYGAQAEQSYVSKKASGGYVELPGGNILLR